MTIDSRTKKQADAIFETEIYPRLTESKHTHKTPVGYVLGGQPGAGKSGLTNHLMSSLNNDAIIINGDDYRRYHPEASALYQQYGADASRFTGEFASYITRKAIDRATAEGYNVIIEGTFRTAEAPINTLQGLKDRGYHTGVAIMTVPAEVSWQGVEERYQKQLVAGEEARHTPRSHHDLVVDKLAENANTVFRSGLADEFYVYNRESLMYSPPKISKKWKRQKKY